MKRFIAPGILLSALLLTVAGTVAVISRGPVRVRQNKYGSLPERMQPLRRQVILFIKNGKLSSAEKLLLRIRRIYQADHTSEKLLSKVFFLKGDLDKAEKLLRELAVRHPSDAVIRNNLGVVLVEKGHYESGKKELLKALELSADAFYIKLNLCHTCALLGRFDLASKYWKEAEKGKHISEIPEEAITRLEPESLSQKEKQWGK
ncbi:MAG: hypothetical protein IKC65_09120 [Lentisphaeria bacterium]|nr:hypothetical protein [Lentisphaeria bacterium]